MGKSLATFVLCLGLLVGTSGCREERRDGAPATETGGGGDGGGGGGGTVATTGTLSVVNRSSTTIYYVYASPSSSSSWGVDQLGSRVILPGQTFNLRSMPCGRNYDIKAEGSSHRVLATRYGVPISCGGTFTWTLTSG